MEVGSPLVTLILVVHVLAAIFWAGSTFVIARSGPPADNRLRAAQAGSAAVTILLGGFLWNVFHGRTFGPSEEMLAGVLACSLLAVIVQQALAWPARFRAQRANTAPTIAVGAERLAALLLALATTGVVVSQYI